VKKFEIFSKNLCVSKLQKLPKSANVKLFEKVRPKELFCRDSRIKMHYRISAKGNIGNA